MSLAIAKQFTLTSPEEKSMMMMMGLDGKQEITEAKPIKDASPSLYAASNRLQKENEKCVENFGNVFTKHGLPSQEA